MVTLRKTQTDGWMLKCLPARCHCLKTLLHVKRQTPDDEEEVDPHMDTFWESGRPVCQKIKTHNLYAVVHT